MSIKRALFRVGVVFAVAFIAGCGGSKVVGGGNNGFGAVDPQSVVRGSFTDPRDGGQYNTVQIGEQTWMAENLKYEAEDSWCYRDDESDCEEPGHGRQYGWETAKAACPDGWHLPNREEWGHLMAAVGGVRKIDKKGYVDYDVAGKKLKSRSGWASGGNGADDYGFSAMPGGYYESGLGGMWVGHHGYWWSATEHGSGGGLYHRMNYDNDLVFEASGIEKDVKSDDWYSVRCVQDN
ncbi:MAG: fibrobacter succinogenes major paralogous domain-containing protein [Chitinispirillales bacterium]|nr:fibrobacter succinogenes major paralogous domain-containing protein [Chitinispirillales bacterium]